MATKVKIITNEIEHIYNVHDVKQHELSTRTAMLSWNYKTSEFRRHKISSDDIRYLFFSMINCTLDHFTAVLKLKLFQNHVKLNLRDDYRTMSNNNCSNNFLSQNINEFESDVF